MISDILLSENTDDSEFYYLLLKNLEEKIRKFLEQELSEHNPQWWKQLIPGDVKQNAEDRKQKDELRKNWDYEKQSLISYIDFTDYEKIIIQKTNWRTIFQYVFNDKNAISVKLREIEPIRNAISHSRNLDFDEIKQLKFYSEDILRGISYYYDNKTKIISEKIELAELKSSDVIGVSFDRTVYPINSTIHLRAKIKKLIPNKSIIFQIFNNNKKIFEKEITPDKFHETETAPDAGIYETSFAMTGNDWKVGEKYVLIGKHSISKATSQTRIDAREPVIQSDKRAYLWGSDMILTVIDPDGDRDNDLVEFVGDRDDAKLIIKSSCGKLENFRLRETGDSTGIFQGIIGFIGVNNDGTKKPYPLKDELIETTQGHELDDGFIEVSENEELEITYSNATKTAKLIAIVLKEPKHRKIQFSADVILVNEEEQEDENPKKESKETSED